MPSAGSLFAYSIEGGRQDYSQEADQPSGRGNSLDPKTQRAGFRR